MSKSQQRIKKTGEIFTPTPLVKEILNKLPQEVWTDPSKTFLDPACGNGQFLIQVLKKKLVSFTNLNDMEVEQQEFLINQIIQTVYGIDLMVDNVADTVARLYLYIKGYNIFDGNAKPINVQGSLLEPHHDDHTVGWLSENENNFKTFKRTYTVKEGNLIVKPSIGIIRDKDSIKTEFVRLADSKSTHKFNGFLFSYSWNDEEFKLCNHIMCADALQMNVDVWDDIHGLTILQNP